MSKTDLTELQSLLTKAATGLSDVTSKKMFGCPAMWAKGNVFALVWKHGRIGVKLPDEASFNALMDLPGAEPWKAGPMKMSHWVLVPAAFHKKPADLKKWAAKAHRLCSKLEAKPKKKAK